MLIHLRIGEIAAQKGIDTSTLASSAKIRHHTALALMRGVVTRIDLAVLDRVCEALNVQPGDLLQRVTDETA